ncbi:Alpha/Beta hydrolase protein [Suillus fuscotomentosus]|uniref:Alpha/Beta hydrolase protein n=1 Tax=Suillus fuscotomentosus TaxID=1912939 RepID=A0AAD4E9B3_9AGAM|nr:Alpha/Beta hydrolase protein [Suillus fuscotomentosus]KAG1901972.1 Alpha/Beta hydrolase protein [Suillus fuscotomentosus]
MHNNLPDDTARPPRSSWKWPHFPGTVHDPEKGIPEEVYNELVRYTKYASGAYQVLCPRPMGNTLVAQFINPITGTQGFIARDDTRKELVVAFRGSREISSAIIDTSLLLSPLRGPGLPENTDAHVHTGFLYAFRSVGDRVLNVLREQFKEFPQYDVTVSGHSLGGAIASIAAVSIRNSFPDAALRLFTFGQPRTGDQSFAELVETLIGVDNVFRGVHSFDGVPTMIPTRLGYKHHATEYWQFTEPPAPRHVRRCVGAEDPEGSASIPSTGINPAHMVYFEQPIASDPTVCI